MAAKLIQFGDNQSHALEVVADRLQQSQTQVVREGFRLFQMALSAAAKGNHLAIVNGDRVISRIEGSWSDIEPVAV